MAKVCVVLRQLPGHDSVVSAVLGEPTMVEVDSLESYFRSEAESHIEKFKKEFLEFRAAHWNYSIHTVR
jgi:hypothetical protein